MILIVKAKNLKEEDILLDRGNFQVKTVKTTFADNRIIYDDITIINFNNDFSNNLYTSPDTMFRIFRRDMEE
ncbi:hypothetical protein PMX22_19765 [Clostridium butyricum]|uniref:hypothetical protein n=1 Tax=Clostridium butyricum TaxID=1492 RepID=UPI00232F584F|nr:hypothetical protein [Clostridium butyricum]MDB2162026.1 hypothetical protein [Clostridium butyricum]